MYLHLGNDVCVKTDDIIAIFDYNLFKREDNWDFFSASPCPDDLFQVGDAQDESKLKSLIVTKERFYVSSISPLTLKKRADNIWGADEEYASENWILEEV